MTQNILKGYRVWQAKGAQPPCKGFSLLEIIVALLLFAIVAALAIPSLRSAMGADLRSSVSRLQGVVQDVYNRAALSDQTHRLVIDLDKQQYWVESTKQQWLLPKERQSSLEAAQHFAQQLGGSGGLEPTTVQQNRPGEAESRSGRKTKAEQSAVGNMVTKMVDQLGDLFSSESLGTGEERDLQERQRAYFRPIADGLGQKTKLPPPVRVQKVWVDHLSSWVESGSVGITFFPGGYTQEAFLVLGIEKRQLVLMVEPLTGESLVQSKEPEIPD